MSIYEYNEEYAKKSAFEEGKSIGITEGKSIGITEGKEFVACNMLRKNKSYEEITEITGLSIDRIMELEKDLLVTNQD